MVDKRVFYYHLFTNHNTHTTSCRFFCAVPCRLKLESHEFQKKKTLESHAMSHAMSSAFVLVKKANLESVTLTNKVECTSPAMDFHYIIVEKWSEF